MSAHKPDLLQLAIESLQNGDLVKATSICEQELAAGPSNFQFELVLGVALRRLGHLQRSEMLLEKVIDKQADIPTAHHELGLALSAQFKLGAALRQLERAVSLQPNLSSAWREIHAIRRARGEFEHAARAYRRVAAISAGPNTQLAKAIELFDRGKPKEAQSVCVEHLKANPTDPEGMRILAEILFILKSPHEALSLLNQSLQISPDFHIARGDLALALARGGMHSESLSEVEKLCSMEPNNAGHHVLLASVLFSAGQYERSKAQFEIVLDKIPEDAKLLTSYGHALRFAGEGADAARAYERAIASDPTLGEAYFSLANLKTYKFDSAALAGMRDARGKLTAPSMDNIHLAFAMGKAYEDADKFDDAFKALKNGNDMKGQSVGYTPEALTKAVDEVIVNDLPAMSGIEGHASSDPIFILGLPRTGSTLIEQILASHSEVEATAELPYLIAIATELASRSGTNNPLGYIQTLGDLTREQSRELGERYLALATKHRSAGIKFIDKQPANWQYIPLIRRILPNAKIIDVRRAPLAVCLANYRQLFVGASNAFSYSLDHLGHYYADYFNLMRYLNECFPDKILTVSYESVVADLATSVRHLLDFCGLEFQEACVNFHQTSRHIRTPSSEQVRLPIYASGLDFWRAYEKHLDPLRETLAQRGIEI